MQLPGAPVAVWMPGLAALTLAAFDASKWVENTLEYFSGRNPPQFSEENARNSLNEIVFRDPLPSPYVALGVGAGVDDEGHFMALALAHYRPEFAIQNREMLVSRILHSGDPFIQFSNVNTSDPARQIAPTLWAETLGASSIETDVNGSSLTVRVRGDFAGARWHSSVRDSPPAVRIGARIVNHPTRPVSATHP